MLVPNFDQFDSYKNYIQRFANYIAMKNITSNEDYCAKLLLNSIGAKNFNMITSLAAPRVPSELKYDELLKLLETHLAPKRNVLVAQHQFLSKYQNDTQSISEFVATLRTDINECEFTSSCECNASVADIFLRAQFIRGIHDNNIHEKLLQSINSNFDQIVSTAIALEAAKVDARELSGRALDNNNTILNKVSVRTKPKRFQKAVRKSKQKGKSQIDYEELGLAGLCIRCGRNNHTARECRTNKSNLKCTSCNKNGHVAKVCISTLLQNKTNSISQVSNNIENCSEHTPYGAQCFVP